MELNLNPELGADNDSVYGEWPGLDKAEIAGQPPVMLILSQDRARMAKTYMNSDRRSIMSRKAYLKQVNDEMGIFKTGRVGHAIAEG
jgi:hypothetical protein